jgi:hypothetical protein
VLLRSALVRRPFAGLTGALFAFSIDTPAGAAWFGVAAARSQAFFLRMEIPSTVCTDESERAMLRRHRAPREVCVGVAARRSPGSTQTETSIPSFFFFQL